jgi:hypothetical protein
MPSSIEKGKQRKSLIEVKADAVQSECESIQAAMCHVVTSTIDSRCAYSPKNASE